MFYNLFFLLVACSNFTPALRIGFFWIFFGPLMFFLLVSMFKEASDRISRYKRDKILNQSPYTLLLGGEAPKQTNAICKVS